MNGKGDKIIVSLKIWNKKHPTIMSHEDALATLILLISSYWNERSTQYILWYFLLYNF